MLENMLVPTWVTWHLNPVASLVMPRVSEKWRTTRKLVSQALLRIAGVFKLAREVSSVMAVLDPEKEMAPKGFFQYK